LKPRESILQGSILKCGSSDHNEDMKYELRSMNQSSRAFDLKQDHYFIFTVIAISCSGTGFGDRYLH